MDFVGVVTGYSGDIQDQLLLVPSWYQKVHYINREQKFSW